VKLESQEIEMEAKQSKLETKGLINEMDKVLSDLASWKQNRRAVESP